MIFLKTVGAHGTDLALFGLFAVTTAAGLIAVLHPHRERRRDAFRVLSLVLGLLKRPRGDR